jgi:AraC family transcriptional regulator
MNFALRWTELAPGIRRWSNAASAHHRFEAGEGRFCFDELTVGLVLVSQPGHWGAYGSDRQRELPLIPGSGWIFPAGLEGACSWQGPQAIINVSLPKALFAEDGMSDIEDFTVGRLDPLTAELIFALHAADEASPALYRESLTLALAAHLAEARLFEKRVGVPDRRILRAMDFIEAHLAEDLSLDRLASVAALSPYHFLRRFKAETGHPPHAYVTIKRMERARLLIETTRRPVADIAWSLGFSDASRFAHLFKRHIGAAPGALRKARSA